MTNKLSIKEVLGFAFSMTRDNFGFLVKLGLVVLIVSVPQSVYSFLVDEEGMNLQVPVLISILLFLVFWLIQLLVQIGSIRIVLGLIDGNLQPISTMFNINMRFLKETLLGYILYFLIILAGLILLIVPGIVWALKYSQWMYLVIDKDMTALEAMKRSGEITKGNKLNLLMYAFIVGIIVIISVIPLGLGLFFSIPMGWIGAAYIYRLLNSSGNLSTTPTNQNDSQSSLLNDTN